MDLFRKTYEIFGMVEKSCVFRVGNGFIRVDFKNGSLATSGLIPASFSTNVPVIQHAIEASDKYKKGIIKLGKSIKIGEIEEPVEDVPDDAGAEGEKSATECENTNTDGKKSDAGEGANTNGSDDTTGGKDGKNPVKDFPEVTSGQMARSILSVEPYNVSLSKLQRNDDIRVIATEQGVTFSNWR